MSRSRVETRHLRVNDDEVPGAVDQHDALDEAFEGVDESILCGPAILGFELHHRLNAAPHQLGCGEQLIELAAAAVRKGEVQGAGADAFHSRSQLPS